MAVKSNLSLNINKDDSNINDFLYVWDYFKSRPNKITLHKTYVSNQFEEILKEYQKEINKFSEIIPSDEENIVNDKIIMTLCINEVICFISYVVVDRNYETSTISDITFFYKEQEDEKLIIDLIKKLDQCYIEFFDEEVNNLNTINFSSSSGLDLESVDPSVDLETFEMYYSASTIKKLNKLIKKVKKNDKGISIIYGERGTGKTSAISQIANKLDRIVIFIPNNMIEHTINNPDFRKFLKRYSKPIIVIDDCEMIFNDYLTKSNMVVNNLLQLSIHLGEKAKYKNKTKLVDIIKKNTLQNNKKIGF